MSIKNVWRIFKRDVRRLLHNPVAMVIIVGVCIIPSLYAWYNIEANWDPYGNTAGVKIAVANEDTGVNNDLVGELNAGEQTIEELKHNDKLGWVFTSSRQAKEGVRSGEYYAAVVIPKNFSKNLTSMLDGDFEQPKLEYYVNEKKNAIAPKVTDTGAQTIEEQLNETFVATASKTLVTEAKARGIEMDGKLNTAQSSLINEISGAEEKVQKVRSSLTEMTDAFDDTKAGIKTSKDTLGKLSNQLPSLVQALEESNGILTTTRGAARDFNASLSTALTSGATQIGAASAKANTAVGTVTGVASEAKLKADAALSSLQEIIDSNTQVIALLKQLAGAGSSALPPEASGAISGLIAKMQEQNAKLQGVKDALQAQSDATGKDIEAASGLSDAMNTAIQGSVQALGTTQQQLVGEVLPQLDAGLDDISNISGDLTGVVSGVEPILNQSAGILDQMSALLDETKAALATTDKLLADIEATLCHMKTDVAALRSSASLDELSGALNMNAEDVAEFMSSPAQLLTKTVYPVKNYGSGVTPFYTNLALWVGGFVLIAIFKLEVDHEGLGAFSANEAYFGRWLLMCALGAVQAIIVCTGDLALGIQCQQPALFMLAGLAISFVYVNIIYALALSFKHIGKALGVILVIVQIPGSSGMYPIEMMPAFFQALHPLLPFTYGINAMRETIGGMYGMDYLLKLAILGIFLALALLVGVWLRPKLLNLNLLFDRELVGTGVMIAENAGMARERFSFKASLKALLNRDAFEAEMLERGRRFEAQYPRLVKAGFCLVFGLPVLLFALTALLDLGIDGKLVLLVLWIVAIIAADAFLIVLEYRRVSLNAQAHLMTLHDDELHAEIAYMMQGAQSAREKQTKDFQAQGIADEAKEQAAQAMEEKAKVKADEAIQEAQSSAKEELTQKMGVLGTPEEVEE